MRKIDLCGKSFGDLYVIKETKDKNKWGEIKWLCECKCGVKKKISGKCLRQYRIKSCGCFKKNFPSRKTHGMSKTKFFKAWCHLKERCLNKKDKNYKNYGSRGIKVCNEWLKFENFKNDMYKSYLEHCKQYGEKQTTIDRINNNGNYEPTNCRWTTFKENNKNRRNTIKLVYNRKKIFLNDFVSKLKIGYSTLHWRLKNNWPVDKILKK